MRLSNKLLLTTALFALTLTGCSSPNSATEQFNETGAEEIQTIRVAASATPMTDAVLAAKNAAPEGYEIELIETTGYFTPNVALRDGEVNANFIQHKPHMQDFNDGNDANLAVVAPIYYVVGSYYSREYDSLNDLPVGAKIVIPNDSNEGRALELLKAEGLIELDNDVPEFESTIADITSNDKNFEFLGIDLMNLNVAYDEADAVFSLGSFARQIDLFPETDGLASEYDERFAVSLVAQEDELSSPKIEALKAAFTSDEVREVLESLDQKVAF